MRRWKKGAAFASAVFLLLTQALPCSAGALAAEQKKAPAAAVQEETPVQKNGAEEIVTEATGRSAPTTTTTTTTTTEVYEQPIQFDISIPYEWKPNLKDWKVKWRMDGSTGDSNLEYAVADSPDADWTELTYSAWDPDFLNKKSAELDASVRDMLEGRKYICFRSKRNRRNYYYSVPYCYGLDFTTPVCAVENTYDETDPQYPYRTVFTVTETGSGVMAYSSDSVVLTINYPDDTWAEYRANGGQNMHNSPPQSVLEVAKDSLDRVTAVTVKYSTETAKYSTDMNITFKDQCNRPTNYDSSYFAGADADDHSLENVNLFFTNQDGDYVRNAEPLVLGLEEKEHVFLKEDTAMNIQFTDSAIIAVEVSLYDSNELEASPIRHLRFDITNGYRDQNIEKLICNGETLTGWDEDIKLTKKNQYGQILRTLKFPVSLLQADQNRTDAPYYIKVDTVIKDYYWSTQSYVKTALDDAVVYDSWDDAKDCLITAVTEPPKRIVVTDTNGTAVTDTNGSTVTTVSGVIVTKKSDTDVTYYLSTRATTGTETVDTLGVRMRDDIGIGTYKVVVKGTGNGGESVMTSMYNDVCTTVTSTVTTAVSVVSSLNDAGEVESDTTVLSEVVTYPTQVRLFTETFSYHDYPDGVYRADVELTDLAGNKNESSVHFVIDNHPPVVEDLDITTEGGGLVNFLTFGMFSKESVRFRVRVSDHGIGCDESGVLLYLNTGSEGIAPEKKEGDFYVFPKLDPKLKVFPFITVTDKNGNQATYYIQPDAENKKPVRKLADLADDEGSAMLLLEQGEPDTDLLPTGYIAALTDESVTADAYSDYETDGANPIKWYPWPVNYDVTAKDPDSGLQYAAVFMAALDGKTDPANVPDDLFRPLSVETDSPADSESETAAFNQVLCRKLVRYSYQLKDEGSYALYSLAADNAQNLGRSDVRLIGIDLTNPEIDRFEFNAQTSDYERKETITDGKIQYEYFFRDQTTVRVFAHDRGSGLKEIDLYLSNVDTKTSTSLSSRKLEPVPGQENLYFADFTIEEGYKGPVYAEAFDRVGRTSDAVDANGAALENDTRHRKHASITLDYEKATAVDANNLPLYNHAVPIDVTVADSFSGIRKIEWSIANDGKSGVLEFDRFGKISGEDGLRVTVQKEENSNLVTEVAFRLEVTSNTNDNLVTVILTDNAGNVTENNSTRISIDTTNPVITAQLTGPAPKNGNYYNSPMSVEISVTERNFLGSDVNVLLNGQRQGASFSDDGIVGEDSTVHNASFGIGTDGIYTVTVTYTDRAGNAGNEASIAEFIIDLTAPSVTVTAVSSNENKQNELSKRALNGYYGIDRNCTVEVADTNLSGQSVTVMRDGVNITEQLKIQFSGDKNGRQTASFQINQNGSYDISAAADDLAGNHGANSLAHFVLDKTEPSVKIKLSDTEGKYLNADKIAPEITFSDKEKNLQLDTLRVNLTQYGFSKKDREVVSVKGFEDASGSAIASSDHTDEESAAVRLKNLTDDGIYELTVTVCDKAGREITRTEQFSVNRKGSTYRIENTDGRENITSVDESQRYYRNTDEEPFSFRVVEVNVNRLEDQDIIVRITRDGNIVENSLRPTLVEGDEKQKEWCVYNYDFDQSMFRESGKYIIKLYSVDQAGNENPVMDESGEDPAMLSFFIDNDSPILYFRDAQDKSEFLGNKTYHADNKKIEIEVYDNSQLEPSAYTFSLIQNGETVPLTAEHTPGTFTYVVDIPNASSIRDLSASITDFAGNQTDEQINKFYVTQNLFVLWYTNKPLMIGTIAGFILLAGAGVFLFLRKKRS